MNSLLHFTYRHGIEFSESNIFRIPDGTIQDGDDTLVSFYGNYPDGLGGGPIPRAVLLGALNERLDSIVAFTEVPAVIEGKVVVIFLKVLF